MNMDRSHRGCFRNRGVAMMMVVWGWLATLAVTGAGEPPSGSLSGYRGNPGGMGSDRKSTRLNSSHT